VKIFFDNCTPPFLASALHGFVSHFDHKAFHISQLPCGRDAEDTEWIKMLADDQSLWMVVTGDDRIRRNRPERTAYREAKLCGFVLAKAYQKTPPHQVASLLLWRWPEMEELFDLVAGPALYEVPISRKGRVRNLPL
jgi:PIN like domain